ncbi:hypothetical protein [Paenibacillus harenae]|uniref:Uncharacterized protein n=1 Tax=Paenibacillus harenae TaxID=306543 RepID=A0ABT9U659_PAEHA|nr:hypothetical protein [Paenibacillus harenae]MDQ0115115.1 hypothetical protein [Paenibacillus harenae]
MKPNITIRLYQDWLDTVKEIFRGSGHPLSEELSDHEVAVAYYSQTASSDEEAQQLSLANAQRLQEMEQILLTNFEALILPDIRNRTGYEGDQFTFRWIYQQGEHVIEEYSEYRIPL